MTIELSLGAIIAILSVITIFRHARGANPFRFFEPIVVVSAVYLVYCAIGPCFRILTGQTTYLHRDMSPYYVEGFTGALVSYLCILLGYHLHIGDQLARWAPNIGRGDPSGKKMWTIGWLLIGIAFIGLLLFTIIAGTSLRTYFLANLLPSGTEITETKFGTGQGYFFMELIELFIPGYVLLLLSRRIKGWLPYLLLLLPIASIYSTFGFRYRIIALFLAIVSAWALHLQKRLNFTKISVYFILVIVVVGFVGLTRSYTGTYSSFEFNLTNILAPTLYETNIFETSACAMSAMSSSHYAYAYLIPVENSVVLLLPRFFWPDKKGFSYNSIAHEAIGTNESYGAGVAYMLFFEYYLMGGYVALIICCIIFGICCRAMRTYLINYRANAYTYVIYPMLLTFIFVALHRGYMAQHVQYFFSGVLLPALVIYFVTRKKQSVSHPAY